MNIHNMSLSYAFVIVNFSNQVQIYPYIAKEIYLIINFTGAKHGIYLSEFNIRFLLENHVMLDDFKFPECLQCFLLNDFFLTCPYIKKSDLFFFL